MGMNVYHWGFVVVRHGEEFLLDLVSDLNSTRFQLVRRRLEKSTSHTFNSS